MAKKLQLAPKAKAPRINAGLLLNTETAGLFL